MQPPSREEINAILEPRSSDVALAKEALMAALCKVVRAGKDDLLSAVLASQQLETRAAFDPSVMKDWPWEQQAETYKWVAAARLALAELQGEALALPMATLSPERNMNIGGWTGVAGSSRSTWSERFEEFDVLLAQSYRAAPKALSLEGNGFVLHDPDLYLQRIDAAAMHTRVSMTLRQAVGCYRSSLYVGAAVLLGSASEGAWIELAQATSDRLDSDAPKLKKMLEGDISQLAEIQKLTDSAIRSNCGDELKEASMNKGRWQTVVDAGGVYRRYRNYAIHFSEDEVEVLDYGSVGLLLLNATAYFNDLYRLKDALATQ